jgi:hypothetical protein
MEVAVDEGRRHESRVGVDRLGGVDLQVLADAHPAAVLGGEVDEPPVEEACVPDDQVH